MLLHLTPVTLKTERTTVEHHSVLKLIGRICASICANLKSEIRTSGPAVALVLAEGWLINAEVVQPLSACEAEAVRLLYCPAYKRKWFTRKESGEQGISPAAMPVRRVA